MGQRSGFRRSEPAGDDQPGNEDVRSRLHSIAQKVKRAHSLLLLSILFTAACSRSGAPTPSAKPKSPLISSATTMMTAWDFPRNPLTDPSLDDSKLSTDIMWGFRIFTNTPGEVPHFAPGKISCNNCH